MNEYYSILTNQGKEKIAQYLAQGQPLTLSQMAVGDGNGAVITLNADADGLVNECHRLALNTVEQDSKNPDFIRAEAILPVDVGGFTVREAGIFDLEGTLIAIAKIPETEKILPAQGSARELTIRFYLNFEDNEVVDLVIDPTQSMVTLNKLEAELASFKQDFLKPAVGSIHYFARETAPEGYLICQKTALLISEFPDLYDVLHQSRSMDEALNNSALFGYRCSDPLDPENSRDLAGDYFVLPDLRGEFIRGWDHGRGVDSGRKFGSGQEDAIRNITGSWYGDQLQAASGAISSTPGASGPDGTGTGALYNFDASFVVPTADDNRPRNIALLACIKY